MEVITHDNKFNKRRKCYNKINLGNEIHSIVLKNSVIENQSLWKDALNLQFKYCNKFGIDWATADNLSYGEMLKGIGVL